MLTRRTAPLVLLAGLSLGLPSWRTVAFAQDVHDPQAEQFVQTQVQSIMLSLTDRDKGIDQKTAAFNEAIDQLADVPRITKFVLGKYARTITPEQHQRFASAFRTYAEGIYQNWLGSSGARTLKVTGSLVLKPGDAIVRSQVSGGKLPSAVPVSWRVLNDGSGWKLVDMEVKGVWLSISQQQDFVSTIDNAGGDIDVLIAKLQRRVEHPASRD